MIEYNELEKTLEKLTIDELEQVKNNLMEFLKEKYAINKLDDYEFIKDSIRKEYIDESTDYYIKLGVLRYGTYGVGELINEIIDEKEGKRLNTMFMFDDLQDNIIPWRRSKNINDPKSQFIKVIEAFGKIQQATEFNDLINAIGNTLIALIILNDILQKETHDNIWIDISEMKEGDLYKYINEKGGASITSDFKRVISTDIIIELSELAECINKITEDNKAYYTQKSYLHISEVFKYILYLTEFENVDFIESLDFVYNTITKKE